MSESIIRGIRRENEKRKENGMRKKRIGRDRKMEIAEKETPKEATLKQKNCFYII